MIAGPNGAGKTTTAFALIPDLIHIYEFLNADEIARGLSPLHPESIALTASKLMIRRFHDLLKVNKSFAFETTASGSNYIKYLKDAQVNGYNVHLLYLWLVNPDIAVERVAHRVAQGGHHIPEEVIRRRYKSGISNVVNEYLPLSDTALLLDNSNPTQKIIAQKTSRNKLEIENLVIWEELQRLAND
jgi:predicted ABC-type ATPase